MDFAQDRITTLHALSGADRVPRAPTDRTAVLVPMAERDTGPGIERVFSALERVDPERVVVALRAESDAVASIRTRLSSSPLSLSLLWCNGPRIEELLRTHDLDGPVGKGYDVWLGLALASRSQFVAIHDADTASYTEAYVPRLVAPLAGRQDDGDGNRKSTRHDGESGHEFVKAYYARIENERLYGRLCRLLYAPLVRELTERHDTPVLPFLDAFRYGLAGECAMTADLARRVRVRRGWGLEVGLLGEAFRVAGPKGVAQVDLGTHDHEHRSVEGVTGLSAMARSVVDGLLQVAEDGGVEPDYATLAERYRERAGEFVTSYAADAAFNGVAYDTGAERRQVAAYAEAISPPGDDDRLPAWSACTITAEAVREAARADLDEVVRTNVSGEAPR